LQGGTSIKSKADDEYHLVIKIKIIFLIKTLLLINMNDFIYEDASEMLGNFPYMGIKSKFLENRGAFLKWPKPNAF
jgi:hypothetical protein